MPYILNTEEDRRAMLKAIGVDSIEQLFATVPENLQLDRPLDIPPAMSELELTQHMQSLAAKNLDASRQVCFLGGGSYDHFIPAVVDAIASRGEFYTSYTPYQPEVSQGNLQAMFEYQTMICQLTGMDVSNASLYDGGSSTVEAVLLCLSAKRGRKKVVVVDSVHPEYRQIVETYLENLDAELVTVASQDGAVDPESLARAVDADTACVVLQHPNFFGCLEDVEAIATVVHEKDALLVQAFDPISLGLLKGPGQLGADIAVAEGQSLGSPMAYGGPYLGIMACREEFVRRLPGRIAGQTTDSVGARCWVLTLQTREQHIRREKATSNICTNQGLYALRACVYLASMGPQGMREVAELCLRKSHFAAEQITEESRFSLAFTLPFFKEFVIRDCHGEVQQALRAAKESGILAGVPLGQWYPEMQDCFLVTVTEKRTRSEIEELAECLQGVHHGGEVVHA